MKNENKLQGYPMWWKLSLVAALIAVLVNLFGPKNTNQIEKTSMNTTYPEPWERELSVGISKALAKHNVLGCGEYAYRKSIESRSEYLLLCSRTGTEWVAYLVWPALGEVTGPVKLPSDIRLPHIK